MKRIAAIVFVFSLIGANCFAQWTLQTNPYGFGSQAMLGKIQFVSQTEGWVVVSSNSNMLHTTDAGSSWTIVSPFPNDTAINMSDPGKSMSWIDSQHGWVLKSFGSFEDNEENIWNTLNGAVIYATTDGGNHWSRSLLPKAFNTTTYANSDMMGAWKLHAICTKNPNDAQSANSWIHADGTINEQGTMSLSGTQSDGQSFVRNKQTSLSVKGKIKIDGQEIGFLNNRKNLAVFTGLEMDDAHALYIAQKIDPSVSYAMTDLQGTWNLSGISVGNNAETHPSSFHAIVTTNNEGNVSGTLLFSNDEQVSIATSLSIDTQGNITGLSQAGTQTDGFMSSDKKTIILTLTGMGGDYQMITLEKKSTSTDFNARQLQGCWQMHTITTDDPNTLKNESSQSRSSLYFNGSGGFNMTNQFYNDQPSEGSEGQLTLSSDGYLSNFGPENNGFGYISNDLQIGYVLYSEAENGLSFGVIQKDLSTSGDMGFQIQFVDQNHGWVSVFNNMMDRFVIYRTTDGGLNWTPINGQENPVGGIYYYKDENNGWLIGSSGEFPSERMGNIFHTTNGGLSWTLQKTNIGKGNDVYFADLNNGWVVGDSALVLKTDNGGSTWTQLTNTGQNSEANHKTVYFLNAQTGWFGSEASDNTEGDGTRYIVRTDDAGAHWDTQSTPVSNSIFSIHFWDANNGWFVSDYGQIAHYSTGQDIQSIRGSKEWTIYPIPAKKQLNITSAEAKSTAYRIEVTDMNGVVRLSTDFKQIPAQVDVSKLHAGIYVVRFTEETTGNRSKAFVFTKE